MANQQAFWVHGSSAQLEREGFFISKRRAGYGIHLKTHSKEWVQFAVPTPVLVSNQRSKLVKVFVCYKTEGSAKITAVHVYDGETKVAGWDKLSLSGDHGSVLGQNNSWLVSAKPEMVQGLGISVLVDFGEATTAGVPGIWFRSAGADFETP